MPGVLNAMEPPKLLTGFYCAAVKGLFLLLLNSCYTLMVSVHTHVVCVRVCVCVCERERESVCVCVCACVHV